jgi:hypothetical protein
MAAAGNHNSKSPIAHLPTRPRSPPSPFQPGNEGPSAPSGPSLSREGGLRPPPGSALDSAEGGLRPPPGSALDSAEGGLRPPPGSALDSASGNLQSKTRRFRGGAGFGGVVFCAPLDISRIAKPTTISWVVDIPAADGAQGWGHFDVVLTDESVVMTRRLYSDDAYAAWEIVNGRSGVFPALDLDHSEGVGLASVDKPGGAMFVHQALNGLEIGNSAVMADAIGFKMGVEAFRQRIEVARGAPSVVEKAMAWQTADKGYYKIIDAPLQVEIRDALVRVERSQADNYPESLRQVGFLAFQAFDRENKPLPETQTPFYEILPVLTTALPAFERLNSFAETFAIMRWAKLSKAAVKPPAPPARNEARLYVFRLPSGDLVQCTHDLSSRDEAALKLADLRRVADATVSTLRAARAPNYPLDRIDEVTALLQDKIRLELAMEELESINEEQSEHAPQIEAVWTELEKERLTKIDDTLQKFSTKAQILIALASPADAATLQNLRDHIETAEHALAESKGALSDAKFLRPIDQRKIKAANDLVDEWTKDLDKARTTFDEAVQARMPSWLATSWPAVQHLAAIGASGVSLR